MIQIDPNNSLLMNPQLPRPKPKLERRNAIKKIDYDPSSSSSSFSAHDSTRPTPSLVLDPRTSFRIKGIEGEFDLICRTLGFSGPEDFAIPTAVWEAQKARRSSFDSASSFSNSADPHGLSTQFQAKVVITKANVEYLGDDPILKRNNGLDSVEFKSQTRFPDEQLNRNGFITGFITREGEGEVSNLRKGSNFTAFQTRAVSVRTIRDRGSNGGGIMGDRPPSLAPPPVMVLPPVADHVSSTWDILRSFAPQDDEDSDSLIRVGDVSSSDEADRVIEEEEEEGEDRHVDEVREQLNSNKVAENELLPEACSSPSNDAIGGGGSDEHDTTGIIMEAVYCVSPNGKFRRNISSWQKGELLGSGSFGTVYEGFTDDGFFFAVKEVSLLDQGSQGKQSILQLEQEISLLGEFEHDNIIQYLGTNKDEAKLYIFLELATKGSLARLYQKYHLKDSQVSVYTRQILNGLRYLHDWGVVHRDIKCANILVDANGSVKLADFGLAKVTRSNDIKSCKGTAFWMAPEVVNLRNRTYGRAADIWSLGCTVLEMLTGRPPYSHLEGMQALFQIGKGERPLVPNSLSKDARDFILECLQVNPNDRPTAVQLLDHPFVKRPIQPLLVPSSPRFVDSLERF